MFLLLAAYAIEAAKKSNDQLKVVIYSTESVVRKQIRLKMKMFPNNISMIVPEKFDMLLWLENYPKVVFIFDEAEEVFEKHALDLRYNGFHGLAAARHRTIFFYTATFSEYWRKVFYAIFDTDATSIDSFPSANKLRNGNDVEAKIQVSVRTSKA